jgi:ribonucleoside-diphosphate reductase alpha chain
MKRVLANDKEVWGFVNPRDSKYDGNPKLNPRELMEKIAEAAHHIGCPGVVFTDTWEDGVTSTNPCGEMPLEDWESCNLGSMNLTKYVIDGDFDYTSFNDDVETAVQFLDNAIDKHSALNEQMRAISHKNRKIGLGVMGFADALMMMDIPYGSEDCMTFIDMLMVNMKTAAEHRSRLIGGEWDGRRNKTLLSIAPTGTISIIAGCSSSIEPVFSLVYRRNQLDGELNTLEINPIFKTYINKLIDSPEQRMDIYKRVMNDGSCKNIPQIPLKMRSVFATAHDINWKTHIDVQARFQQWVDNAVSKTINLPKTTTPKDVYDAYIYGWKKHLKGLTVYVDGSHKNQVLNMVDGSCASGVCEM